MDTMKSEIAQRLELATANAVKYCQHQVEQAHYPCLRAIEYGLDDALTDAMQTELGSQAAIAKRIVAQCFPTGQLVNRAMVERILREHQDLHMVGYGNLRQRSWRFTPAQIADYRDDLMKKDSVSRIDAACAWIEHNLRPWHYIDHNDTSYGIKHAAEPFIGYTTNGQFIVAMLLCGYRMGQPVFYNPSFNVRKDSVKRAWAAAQRLPKHIIRTERTRQEFYRQVLSCDTQRSFR